MYFLWMYFQPQYLFPWTRLQHQIHQALTDTAHPTQSMLPLIEVMSSGHIIHFNYLSGSFVKRFQAILTIVKPLFYQQLPTPHQTRITEVSKNWLRFMLSFINGGFF